MVEMGPSGSALVLEDNPHMRTMLRHLLLSLDVEHIDAVASIAEAKARLEAASYDFAIVDVGLGRESGLDFIHDVRRGRAGACSRMPIVVLSGQNQLSVIAQARDAGADCFLTKPVTAAALRDRVLQVRTRARAFIDGAAYAGPDRRRRCGPAYGGPKRRVTDPAP